MSATDTPRSESCHCHGIGPCPHCWGRTAIDELERDLAAVTRERDALRRTLETPPGCEHAGMVYAHCLACELDAEKTRCLMMKTTAVFASNEAERLRDALSRIATEIVAVAPDSGQSDSIGEIYHLLREIDSHPLTHLTIKERIRAALGEGK